MRIYVNFYNSDLVARRGIGSGIAPGLGKGRKQGGDGISTGLSLEDMERVALRD